MNKKVFSLGIEHLENKKLLSTAPNDPLINNQWALRNMSAFGAWDYSRGSRDVVVAIIDSGIDLNHQDLIGNLWTNSGEIAGDGIDNEGNGYIDDIHGWNFYSNNNDIQDRYGHGTHIAGVIGAEGNNAWGVAGINWNVSLMTLKFTDEQGMGYTGAAANAMSYISMMKNTYGVNVVVANASWGGGTGFSNMLYGAINQLNNDGVILTVAAGNNGSDNDITLRYPSCYDSPNIISVGALSSYSNGLVGFSNYGATTVDLAAPGSIIYSTIPYNNYGYMSGTSMAAPQVAGAVALLKAIKPSLSISEVKEAIFSSVDRIPELFGKVASGGKLNIAAAVCNVLNIPYDSNHVPIGAITFQDLKTVGGWANDPDFSNSPISVKLIINGSEKGDLVTGVGGVWRFNLGGLVIGDHIIEIKARDLQSGLWNTIGTTTIKIAPPVVRVGFLSKNRVSGWAFSERSGSSPVVVRVVINGRVVTGQLANKYKQNLVPVVGSGYHGFNISLNRNWLKRGNNNIQIVVFDPISGQTSVGWNGIVRR
jgi:hypothetical protein